MPQEDDIPDWLEGEEEKIPPTLEKKWQEQERKGLRAGICKTCGWVFGQDELTCAHCDTPTEMTEGVLISLKKFFLGTPIGILSFIFILAAMAFFLVAH